MCSPVMKFYLAIKRLNRAKQMEKSVSKFEITHNQACKRFNTNKTVTSRCAVEKKMIAFTVAIAAVKCIWSEHGLSLTLSPHILYSYLFISLCSVALCVQVHVPAHCWLVHMEQYTLANIQLTIHLNYKLRIKSTIQLMLFSASAAAASSFQLTKRKCITNYYAF